jgi:DNA polymerase/3'-5' exonuclease PolX
MPGRKELFDAGIETLEECHKIADFAEINGIGKALSTKIKKYINTEK